MTDAYVDFLEELFPAISPYTAQRAKDAVREFSRYGSKAPFFAEPLDEEFQQGDIFSKVPFVYVDKEGQGQLAVLGGMLLTNSCDIVRNDNLQFAAMTPIDEYSRDAAKQEAVRSNENYEYLYFPDARIDNQFVNFGLITSISRTAFEKFVEDGHSERIASLSSIGYFLFMVPVLKLVGTPIMHRLSEPSSSACSHRIS